MAMAVAKVRVLCHTQPQHSEHSVWYVHVNSVLWALAALFSVAAVFTSPCVFSSASCALLNTTEAAQTCSSCLCLCKHCVW